MKSCVVTEVLLSPTPSQPYCCINRLRVIVSYVLAEINFILCKKAFVGDDGSFTEKLITSIIIIFSWIRGR